MPRSYFHGSRNGNLVGLRISPNPKGYAALADRVLEALFERRRPSGCLPRAGAVFMVADPDEVDAAGGCTDFIYRVEPICPPEAHDVAWYSEAAVRLSDGDPPGAEACADAYWDGRRFPVRSARLVEYLASGATVAECVGGDEVQDNGPATAPG